MKHVCRRNVAAVLVGLIACAAVIAGESGDGTAPQSGQPGGAKPRQGGGGGNGSNSLRLTLRTRKPIAAGAARFAVEEQPAEWDARQTALVICDLWDQHWCER